MNRPITCLACGNEVMTDLLVDHLEGHQVSTGQLEELLQTIREESVGDVATAAAGYRDARGRLDQAVASARAGGASWTEIGKAAGITRQAARVRWSR